MPELFNKILEKIDKEKIKPIPRWHFLARNLFIWGALLVTVIIAGLSLGILFHNMSEFDWDIYQYLHRSLPTHILYSIPYLWILLSLVFFTVAYYDYQHTKGGYRHAAVAIVFLGLAIVTFLGVSAYYLGFGNKMDLLLSQKIPYYSGACAKRMEAWSHPELGLLAGCVVGIPNESMFNIEDNKGRIWNIRPAVASPDGFNPSNAEEVKIIGKEENDSIFEAQEIRASKEKSCGCGEERGERRN
jgi:hypothetical protein